MKTYSGGNLLKKHDLTENGTWVVYGEDPNPDWFASNHHEPVIGIISGLLIDVIHKAVELPRFWQWGGGGRIEKMEPVYV